MLIGLVKFGLVIFIIFFVWASVKDTEIGEAGRSIIKKIKELLHKRDDNNDTLQPPVSQVQQ